jgi:hypothetical protein
MNADSDEVMYVVWMVIYAVAIYRFSEAISGYVQSLLT